MARKNKPPVEKESGKEPLKDVQQELFCVLYTSNSTPRFFGHGQNCYAEAYGHQPLVDALELAKDTPRGQRTKSMPEQYKKILGKSPDEMTTNQLDARRKSTLNTCRSLASRLLTNDNIKARCAHLLDSFLSNEVMDRELAFVAVQRNDLASKVMAIRHYNEIRKRVTKDPDGPAQKVEVEFKWQDPEPRKPVKAAKEK